jgi:hypothetical protein
VGQSLGHPGSLAAGALCHALVRACARVLQKCETSCGWWPLEPNAFFFKRLDMDIDARFEFSRICMHIDGNSHMNKLQVDHGCTIAGACRDLEVLLEWHCWQYR